MVLSTFLSATLVAVAWCAMLCSPVWGAAAPPGAITIYLVSHGWHTGIVVPRREISGTVWRGGTEFPEAEFIEFGWGDEAFYRDEDPAFFQSLKAALLPSPAVLHVVEFTGPVAEFFPASGVVAIEIDPEGFRRLTGFLEGAFVKSDRGEVRALGSGLYGNSRFFAAHGTYTVFNNCNHWVARGLAAAGVSIDPDDAMTATAVFDQARKAGTTVRDEP